MGQIAPLGVLGITEQRRAGSVCQGQVLRLPGVQAAAAEQLQQFAVAQPRIKLPIRARGQRAANVPAVAQVVQGVLKPLRHPRAVQHLAGGNAGQGFGQLSLGAFGQVNAPLRHTHPRQPHALAAPAVQGQQHGLALVRQQRRIGQRAGRDHAHHLALHRPLAHAHLAHLLANGHRLAQLDEAGQVIFQGMKRHPRHAHRKPRRLPARGQRDVQQAHGFFGIVPEQLVKIAHAVEHQGVRVVFFDSKVLRHHGRVLL